MSTGSVGYTSGALYKRHQHISYQSGNKFKRWGGFGLIQQRNMSSMNRQAAANYQSAFSSVGLIAFDANLIQSEGHSEMAAENVLKRVKAQMTALADKGSALSTANGGNGGTTTGSTVDKSA
jgi:hypothetical protein